METSSNDVKDNSGNDPVRTGVFARMKRQSTVYRRHQARLARSQQAHSKKDDSDPMGKGTRRLLMDQYNVPTGTSEETIQDHTSGEFSLTGKKQPISFSENTTTNFQLYNGENVSETRLPSKRSMGTLDPHLKIGLQSALAAAIGGVIVESTTFNGPNSVLSHKGQAQIFSSSLLSRFERGANSYSSAPTFVPQRGGLMAIAFPEHFRQSTFKRGGGRGGRLQPYIPSSSSDFAAQRTAIAKMQISRGAASAGFLFGTTAFARSWLCDSEEDARNPFSMAFVMASAMGGAAVSAVYAPIAMVQTQISRSTQHQQQQHSIGIPKTMRNLDAILTITNRHSWKGFYAESKPMFQSRIMGTVLYFSSYEWFKSVLSTSKRPRGFSVNDDSSSFFDVILAGSLAGMSRTALLHAMSPIEKNLLWGTAQVQSLAPSLLRAAPYHAVLFLGYEAALGLFAIDSRVP
eukprot:CAMPEP_0198305510 /NCGR_PEP_ID=MMETSP1449-20131203/57945_1 /TAXON_ID=420275 /ORGANISM="Attheya septentrionalis, Strain CCMP2084" /LENGTH=459 /DNA_ID=CAMNT_0044008045 /DNA_START=193 /DNA_END=1572 /DNA_ORIENTATION=+